MTLEEMQDYANDIISEYHATQVMVARNNRLSRSAGRAFLREARIEVGGFAIDEFPAEALREVIRHEVAHLLAWRFDGHSGHGGPWRWWAERLGCVVAKAARREARVAATREWEARQ